MNGEMRQEVTAFLEERDIPFVGTAAVSQMRQLRKGFSPGDILKEARSVICFGLPVPRGVLFQESSALASYWRYCNMSYRHLDITANRLSSMLEDMGHWATPVYGCFPWKTVGNEYFGLLPLVHLAEEAGLGKLTRSGLLAHPRYGTRILLAGVVSTAEMEASEKKDVKACPPLCRDCIDVCPVKAISETGKVSHSLCIRHSGANPLLMHLLRDQDAKEKFSFETLLNTVGVDDHGTYSCFRCVEVCPLNR